MAGATVEVSVASSEPQICGQPGGLLTDLDIFGLTAIINKAIVIAIPFH